MANKPQVLRFPDSFLFGTATSAHQIEGCNTKNDWWQWEQDGRVKEKSGKACDSWNRWKEDLDLAKSLNNNAYRFSVEWARIEPEEGKFDLEALKHYEEEIIYLHHLKMKAVLTLWHFSSPEWFAKKGGFAKKENLKFFYEFVEYVVGNLTEYPDYWIVFNEPNSYLSFAFQEGFWPPGKASFWVMIKTYLNFLKAYKESYTIIHKKIPKSMVSLAPHVIWIEILNQNFVWKTIQKIVDLVVNWPFFIPLRRELDYVCLNYYVVHILRWKNFFPKIGYSGNVLKMLEGEKADIGWPIYPQGLYKFLLNLKKYDLPILITENGIDDGRDEKRGEFIANHLEYVWQAIADGVNVVGYFHWTLMDNFEWAMGYGPKFGLFETDFKTFERKARPSAQVYTKICKDGALTLN